MDIAIKLIIRLILNLASIRLEKSLHLTNIDTRYSLFIAPPTTMDMAQAVPQPHPYEYMLTSNMYHQIQQYGHSFAGPSSKANEIQVNAVTLFPTATVVHDFQHNLIERGAYAPPTQAFNVSVLLNPAPLQDGGRRYVAVITDVPEQSSVLARGTAESTVRGALEQLLEVPSRHVTTHRPGLLDGPLNPDYAQIWRD